VSAFVARVVSLLNIGLITISVGVLTVKRKHYIELQQRPLIMGSLSVSNKDA